MTKPQNVAGRIALRVEGNWWVAYYAVPGTMEGAVELARIHMMIVDDPMRKEAFMQILQTYIADFIEAKTGHRPDHFDRDGAPESERNA